MIKAIIQEANLSLVYTNGNIRATSVTILDQASLESRNIVIVSGHRSEKSIQHYSRTVFNKKGLTSDTITNYCSTEKRKCVRDENVNFDFGVEFDVPQQNLVTEHQIPKVKKLLILKNLFPIATYISKIVHAILTNN